jgi:hypothetical protein
MKQLDEVAGQRYFRQQLEKLQDELEEEALLAEALQEEESADEDLSTSPMWSQDLLDRQAWEAAEASAEEEEDGYPVTHEAEEY